MWYIINIWYINNPFHVLANFQSIAHSSHFIKPQKPLPVLEESKYAELEEMKIYQPSIFNAATYQPWSGGNKNLQFDLVANIDKAGQTGMLLWNSSNLHCYSYYYFLSLFCLHNKLTFDTIGSACNKKICIAIQTDSGDCSTLAENSVVASLNLRIEKLESDLMEEKGNNNFCILLGYVMICCSSSNYVCW